MKSLINQICVCRSCNGDGLEIHNTERRDCLYNLVLNVMTVTGHINSFLPLNSNFQRKIPGQKSYEINIRSVIAFREIGRGHEAMKTFTTMMNMLKPLAIASFNDINNNLYQIYIDTALQSIKVVGNEVRMPIEPGCSEGDIVDCQVSIDGSWHK